MFLALIASIAAAPAGAVTPDPLAYMQARAADGDGDATLAARRYAAALDAAPDDAAVAAFAYREAIAAGDLALADRAATLLGPAAPADAALLALAAAARARDLPAADRAIARIASGKLALLAAPLRAWAALDRGADPLAALGASRPDAVARRFAGETRAIVLLAQDRIPDGLAALRALLGNDQASEDLRIGAARLLIGAGKRDAALSLLTGDAPVIAAMRAAPGEGARPSLAFGSALLFTRVASDLSLGAPGPLSLVLAQAALRADPGNDRARLLLAAALAKNGVTDRALSTLAGLPDGSPYAAPAAAGRIRILADAGRTDEALAVARVAARGVDAPHAAVRRLADLLLAADRPAEAAALYKKLIDRDGAADWAAWLQYGGALDQAGDWRRAEPALARAVALAPQEAVALNYLGYARIEHGAPIAPARALLERASRLAPDDASITDSLGWADHLAGNSAAAIPLLERAAGAAPDNAEIGAHLGDAYWAVGRRYEARYAWHAAQSVADERAAKALAARIADGPRERR